MKTMNKINLYGSGSAAIEIESISINSNLFTVRAIKDGDIHFLPTRQLYRTLEEEYGWKTSYTGQRGQNPPTFSIGGNIFLHLPFFVKGGTQIKEVEVLEAFEYYVSGSYGGPASIRHKGWNEPLHMEEYNNRTAVRSFINW